MTFKKSANIYLAFFDESSLLIWLMLIKTSKKKQEKILRSGCWGKTVPEPDFGTVQKVKNECISIFILYLSAFIGLKSYHLFKKNL